LWHRLTASPFRSIYEGDEEVVDLATRIIGRVSCESVVRSGYEKKVVKRTSLIDEHIAAAIEKVGVESLKIPLGPPANAERRLRDVLRTQPATGQFVKLGEAVALLPRNQAASRHAADDADVPHRRHGEPDVQQPIIKAKNDGTCSSRSAHGGGARWELDRAE